MIPKIIHYCWFGRNPLPEQALFCIDSWRKYCPDYEIIEWNEDTFDINCNTYVKEAYENRKWAFVTDYVRLYALDKFGGIYMDTDVEVLKSLDPFLTDKGFSGFESNSSVPTGLMAAESHHPFIKQLLDDYDNRHFIIDGKMDMTTNTEQITKISLDNGLVLNNELQTVCDYTFYPSDYFCPKNSQTLKVELTANSTAIHHFAGSWMNNSSKLKGRMKKILGPRMCEWILRNILRDKNFR